MNELKESVSEYKIEHTTYIVKTVFNPVFRESLSDILERLIKREIKLFIESEQIYVFIITQILKKVNTLKNFYAACLSPISVSTEK